MHRIEVPPFSTPDETVALNRLDYYQVVAESGRSSQLGNSLATLRAVGRNILVGL
jgi:hypothetical protein